MDRKRLFVNKKNSNLYNNVWKLSNAQAITTKFLYNLGLQDLNKKLKFNKDIYVKNLFFISLVKFGQ